MQRLIALHKQHVVTEKFLTIGGVGFICNYATLWVANSYLGLNKVLAELCAAVVALQVTFLLHDRWTYRSAHGYNLGLGARYRLYIVSNTFASLLTVVFFALFSIFLVHLPALALAALVGLAWNFLLNKGVIWRHAARTAPVPPKTVVPAASESRQSA